MLTLEFECTNCHRILKLECSEEDKNYYEKHRMMDEKGDLYMKFFNGAGWVLQQNIFCDICKYDYSECYEDYRKSLEEENS